jgi:hypothetical protein
MEENRYQKAARKARQTRNERKAAEKMAENGVIVDDNGKPANVSLDVASEWFISGKYKTAMRNARHRFAL